MECKTERRIYSINKLAYLLSVGVKIDLKIEADVNGRNKLYGVVEGDISDIIANYYQDEQLHKFIGAFREIKGLLKIDINTI